MGKWHKQGWETLEGNQPEVVAARESVLRHLWDVPEPNRAAWEKRLKSKLDHSHFSVRLEISLHHFFKERGWEIYIEPELPGTSNRPDFRIRRGTSELVVEAKTVLDPQPVDQQDNRLRILVDGVSDRLSRAVSIHPCFDLPPSLPNRRIAAEIEKKASGAELLQEFRIEGEHQGHPYSLDVTILLADEQTSTAGVGATIGQAYTVDIGNPTGKAIQEKAIKYGDMDGPFVVAVWPKLGSHFSYPNDDDLVALYGDKVWNVPAPGVQRVEETVKPNGVFTLQRADGTRRYSRVSAVMVCQLDRPDYPRVYHNPFAGRPLASDILLGIPQCFIDLTSGREEWRKYSSHKPRRTRNKTNVIQSTW